MPQPPEPAASGPNTPQHRQMALAALAGAGTALGLAPFNLWPLALLALAALLEGLLRARGRRHAAALGWAAGTGYFALALIWIVEPFLIEPWRHGWMAPFALFFMSAGLALFWAGAAALAQGRGRLGLIGALGLAEFARAHLFTGFPWALLGYIWTDSPLALLAAFIGPHGLTLLALAGASALALAVPALVLSRLPGAALMAKGRATRPRPASLGALLPLLALLVAFALTPLLRQDSPARANAPLIRLIQPNAAQHEKWSPDRIPVFYARQLAFTRAPAAGGQRPDLIVWPETALPWSLSQAGPELAEISEAAGDVPVVFGIQRFEGQKLHNTLALLSGTGQISALYDKHHLVPFGEYLPFGTALARLGLRGLAARALYSFSPGSGPKLIDIPGLGRFAPLICYEAVFPAYANAFHKQSTHLLQITNDAWFGRFSGPQQHLAQARMRAIEQGKPMIRSANTGISAIIDAQGRVTAALKLGESGYLDAPLPAPLPAPTLYARTKDTPAIALALALLAGSLRAPKRRTPPAPKAH
jgi:apolipoprotein N-acyltransferase